VVDPTVPLPIDDQDAAVYSVGEGLTLAGARRVLALEDRVSLLEAGLDAPGPGPRGFAPSRRPREQGSPGP
jgi:hypothetical protein